MTPFNPPIIVPETGGSFDFDIGVQNNTVSPQPFDIWTQIFLPNVGSIEILSVTGMNIPGNASISRERTQFVPASAPAGVYTYYSYIGDYPWTIDHFDSFTFEKEGTDYAGSLGLANDWISTGESFEDFVFESSVPNEYKLHSAYPNPFNPSTTIRFDLPEASSVSLTVFDLTGREVAQLVKEYKPAGKYEVEFDGKSLSSGMYFARLAAGEFVQTRKLLLVK